MTSRVRQRMWALMLVCVAACTSPATTMPDTPVVGEEPQPSFAPGGPDAEEFGASSGYPKGTPLTFWRTRWLVGSHSHLDEIFRGRLVHKGAHALAARTDRRAARHVDVPGRRPDAG